MKARTLAEIDAEGSATATVPQLIGADEIADLMRVTRTQVYRLVREGKFPRPTIAVGRILRWSASDYVAWVEAQRDHGAKQGRHG